MEMKRAANNHLKNSKGVFWFQLLSISDEFTLLVLSIFKFVILVPTSFIISLASSY